MKIDEISKQIGMAANLPESVSRARTGSDEHPGAAASAGNQEAGAKIVLSKTSLELSKVAEATERQDPGRIDRVNQLKEAIASNQYDIDSSQVAEKVVLEGLMDTLKS